MADVEKEAKDAHGDEDVVNPWSVSSTSEKGVDYNKLIGKY
jgi:hypothetical protein